MKTIGGITRAVLDSILSAYATVASLTSYVTTAALAAYNYATQAWTTSFVQSTLASAFVAFNIKDNVQYSVNYVQSSIPDGTGATENELCLVTGEAPAIYEFTTAWAKLADLEDTERVVFCVDGSDETEPGYVATMSIYSWDGKTIDIYALVANDIFYSDSNNAQYRFNGSECVEFPTPATNLLSDAQKMAIDNANLKETDTVAKVSDIPAQQLSSGELTAIQNASLQATDTVAKTSDLLSFSGMTNFKNGIYCGADPLNPYSTVALLHFEGANGSTDIVDAFGNSWTISYSGTISTRNYKFGTSSFYSGGTSSSVQSSSVSYVIGTNDFTIEEWIVRNGYGALFGFHATNNMVGYVGYVGYDGNNLYFYMNGVYVFSIAQAWTNGTWAHIALTRKNGIIRLFFNGNVLGTYESNYNFDGTYLFAIGAGSVSGMMTYYDEFRFSNTYARWDSSFVPPSSAYTENTFGTEGEVRLRDEKTDTYVSLTHTNYTKLLRLQTPHEGASAPELSDGELRMWKNTSDGILYQVYRYGGTTYKSPAWASL